MDDRDLFFTTLRMYELAHGQPKPRLLDEATDVTALVDELFTSLAE